MFTRRQEAQVKQFFIKNFKRFVTQDELDKVYAADYAAYEVAMSEMDLEEIGGYMSYDQYFGDLFEDNFSEEAFMWLVYETLFQEEISKYSK